MALCCSPFSACIAFSLLLDLSYLMSFISLLSHCILYSHFLTHFLSFTFLSPFFFPQYHLTFSLQLTYFISAVHYLFTVTSFSCMMYYFLQIASPLFPKSYTTVFECLLSILAEVQQCLHVPKDWTLNFRLQILCFYKIFVVSSWIEQTFSGLFLFFLAKATRCYLWCSRCKIRSWTSFFYCLSYFSLYLRTTISNLFFSLWLKDHKKCLYVHAVQTLNSGWELISFYKLCNSASSVFNKIHIVYLSLTWESMKSDLFHEVQTINAGYFCLYFHSCWCHFHYVQEKFAF